MEAFVTLCFLSRDKPVPDNKYKLDINNASIFFSRLRDLKRGVEKALTSPGQPLDSLNPFHLSGRGDTIV